MSPLATSTEWCVMLLNTLRLQRNLRSLLPIC